MTERHLRDDPPSHEQVIAATADIDAAIAAADAQVDFGLAQTLVGPPDPVTTVAALALGLEEYDANVINGSRVSAADVDSIATSLLMMKRTDRAMTRCYASGSS